MSKFVVSMSCEIDSETLSKTIKVHTNDNHFSHNHHASAVGEAIAEALWIHRDLVPWDMVMCHMAMFLIRDWPYEDADHPAWSMYEAAEKYIERILKDDPYHRDRVTE